MKRIDINSVKISVRDSVWDSVRDSTCWSIRNPVYTFIFDYIHGSVQIPLFGITQAIIDEIHNIIEYQKP